MVIISSFLLACVLDRPFLAYGFVHTLRGFFAGAPSVHPHPEFMHIHDTFALWGCICARTGGVWAHSIAAQLRIHNVCAPFTAPQLHLRAHTSDK